LIEFEQNSAETDRHVVFLHEIGDIQKTLDRSGQTYIGSNLILKYLSRPPRRNGQTSSLYLMTLEIFERRWTEADKHVPSISTF
jgi:hypothetical protein